MSEETRNPKEPTTPGTEETSYVPASVYKRVWAWVGVVYMVILVLLITYYFATWTFLTGIGGVMLFPVLGGFSVVKGIQAHEMEHAADRVGPIFWSVLSGILCVICLIWGIFQVIALF
jgi:hypothetical protein